MNKTDYIYKGYEIFIDHSYFYMWAVRKAGVTSWDETSHYTTREKAEEHVDKEVE